MSAYPPPPGYQPPGQPAGLQPFPSSGSMPGASGQLAPPPPAGPKQYGAFAAMVLAPAFHSGLYRDVARNWRGIAALYLLLLTAITGAITAAKAHYEVRSFAQNEFPTAVQDVPPIAIRDGVVSSPVQQPYEIAGKDGDVFAIIDTTGAITSLKNTNAHMLLTKSELHYRDNSQIKIQDLSQIKHFDLDRETLKRWMNIGAAWTGPVVFFVLLIFGFIYRLLQALLYALFGMIFAAMFKAQLSYQQLIRLSIIAVTPVILLDTLLDVVGVSVPFFALICFPIAMLYLAMAVKANAAHALSGPTGFDVYTPPQPYPPQTGRPMGM